MRRDSLAASFPPSVLRKIERLPRPDSVRVKIISMGDEGVGKSCLIKRYCEEQFVRPYITTIGVDFGVKQARVGADGKMVKVNFWDLSGNQEFFEIRNEFYADAGGVLLVYDASKPASFANLEAWWDEATRYGAAEGIPVAVCANKQDLLEGKPSGVPPERAKHWCASKGFRYYETSACTAQNVHKMFEELFEATYNFCKP